MTDFSEGRFQSDDGYLTWHGEYQGMPSWGEDAHPSKAGKPRTDLFIARNKRGRPITNAQFKRQLIKRFTVEEFVARRDAGLAPLEILRDDDPVWYVKMMNQHSASLCVKN